MSDIPHGTTNGYANHGCRCTDCRAANNARGRRQRDRKREEAS